MNQETTSLQAQIQVLVRIQDEQDQALGRGDFNATQLLQKWRKLVFNALMKESIQTRAINSRDQRISKLQCEISDLKADLSQCLAKFNEILIDVGLKLNEFERKMTRIENIKSSLDRAMELERDALQAKIEALKQEKAQLIKELIISTPSHGNGNVARADSTTFARASDKLLLVDRLSAELLEALNPSLCES